MSNFTTFGIVSNAIVGTGPTRFVASTPDSLATMLAIGYLNDKSELIKANDIIDVNYLDTSTFPLNTGEAALFASFAVQYDPILGNWNLLLRSTVPTGIGAFGVHSANYSNAGGSATTVINDASISPSSVVLAKWKSSANAVGVLTVLPGVGTLTVVSSADPGVSVLEYISLTPSIALQNKGVIAGKFSSAGASATIVITAPLVTSSMIVNVNFQSQASAAEVYSALAGNGIITVVASAAPGANVIEYSAVTPSTALTALGYYGAAYSNAGGSTTITITDANILAGSVVVANFGSQANASYIEKVTPSAGSLVLLVSADPGISVVNYSATNQQFGAESGTFLLAANNLADVASASASLANLGGLPLAGGQMTGQLLVDRGTGTSTAGAVTINHQAGVITTEALTTAAASAYAFTLTDSRITTASIVMLQLMGGTNTTRGLELRAIPGSGTATISIYNNNVAGTALNGTLIFGFEVL